jgi:hypothetical protein
MADGRRTRAVEQLARDSMEAWKHWEMQAWKMEAEKQEAEKRAEWKHGRRQEDKQTSRQAWKHGSRGVLDALPHLAAMPSPRRARCPMVAEIWEQGQGPPGAAMKSLGRRGWTSPVCRPQASGRQSAAASGHSSHHGQFTHPSRPHCPASQKPRRNIPRPDVAVACRAWQGYILVNFPVWHGQGHGSWNAMGGGRGIFALDIGTPARRRPIRALQPAPALTHAFAASPSLPSALESSHRLAAWPPFSIGVM